MKPLMIWPTKLNGDETLDTVSDISDRTIEELAVALSRINRYNGRGFKSYNVAQHSVLISTMVSDKNKLHGLLHDIHEVCIGDINGIFKRVIGLDSDVLRRAEDYVQSRVLCQLGVAPTIPKEVHEADRIITDTEIQALNSEKLIGIKPYHSPGTVHIDIWDDETSAEMFVSFYNSLTGRNNPWIRTQI